MTDAVKRDRLLSYISAAEDKDLDEVYSLLKGHVNLEDVPSSLTPEQLAIVEQRREAMLNGSVSGIDRHTLHENVRKGRAALR